MAFLTKGLRIILRDTRVEDDTHENAQIQTLLERAYEDRENEDSENMEVFPDDEKEREEEKEELKNKKSVLWSSITKAVSRNLSLT